MKAARASFCFLFTLAILTAWILRDFAKPLMEQIPWIVRPGTVDIGEDEDFSLASERWYGAQAVYRVSMGNFLFFCAMSMLMLGVKYTDDPRAKAFHHGHWLVKLALWLVFTAMPFLFPLPVITAYTWLARLGSGLFLVLQLIILLDFVQGWNDAWAALGEDDDPRYYTALLAMSAVGYGVTLTLTALMFVWFKPADAGDCALNVVLITLTLLLCLGVSLLAIQPFTHRGSLFVAASISLYCTYLAYSALQSEPYSYECNGVGRRISAGSRLSLAASMLVTILAVVYAAFRAGSNTGAFFDDDEDQGGEQPDVLQRLTEEGGQTGSASGGVVSSAATPEKKPVSYNYSFFHVVFALASTYIAMLMTGWGSGEGEEEQMDVGWASVWVKIASQWLAFGLYVWMLLAPMIFPDRDYS